MPQPSYAQVKASRHRAEILSAALAWTVPAGADIYGYTDVSYDESANTVNGYAWTYADPWESQWSQYCDEWAYDPEYGEEYCVRGRGFNDTLDADATLYTPSGSNGATSRTIAWPLARASYSVTPWEYGDWVTYGDHYVVEEVYDYMTTATSGGGRTSTRTEFTWDTRHSAERQRKPAAGQRDPMRRDGGVERAFLAAGKRQRR